MAAFSQPVQVDPYSGEIIYLDQSTDNISATGNDNILI